jgi:hypothetical protein
MPLRYIPEEKSKLVSLSKPIVPQANFWMVAFSAFDSG